MSYLLVPKYALGIDWETSGYSLPDYTKEHQGIAVGALIVEIETLKPVEVFYNLIKFNPKYKWTGSAEQIHGITREDLAKAPEQEQVAVDFCNLIVKYFGSDPITVIAHRANFDIAFTNQLTRSIDIELHFHPTVIDSASIFTALFGISKSDTIFEILGLQKRGKHNALEDITQTVEALRKTKEHLFTGLATTLT